MQAVIAIPELHREEFFERLLPGVQLPDKVAADLLRPVAGIPLLTRVLATAVRAGTDRVLLIWPSSIQSPLRERVLQSKLLHGLEVVNVVAQEPFGPTVSAHWKTLRDYLAPEFLWLPWNWVTTKQCLIALEPVSMSMADWSRPALIARNMVGRCSSGAAEGVAVISPETAARAERLLVARSGKVLDGIHTSFNRRLCRPLVRWLSHTRTTPNQVSIAGLFIAILSCCAFTQGVYCWYVLGALLFFVAGLFDEMDGMLARIKFADSPFGTWLEGFIDGISYLLLFGGAAVGLFRQHGKSELFVGVALLIGSVISIAVTAFMRKHGAPADRPNEYLGNLYQLLEKDSSNKISFISRQMQAFVRRGVMIHYVVIFTLLHGLCVFFYLAAIGSHLTWILALYFNRRFFRKPYRSIQVPNPTKGLETL
ncbi:MAG TPA: CDP-alcohol phosphatidyltransferase family protein [Bryobacteraceae bacterium]|nr:CDP-alcohol phosphatidyltransferase family protein [Candidatus Acidoferrales bacterium]